MSDLIRWHNNLIGSKVVEALERNNFKASYCHSGQEAVEQILELIPSNASVGIGGSWTIKELGLLSKLAAGDNIILNHNNPDLNEEEKMEIRRQQLTCDVFLTGTNAITMDGKIVNTDGTGNRVAAMIFGPKKVIIVAGINKIVKNIEEAEIRIKSVAAPINSKRVNAPNPCTKTGICMDCQGPTRICNVTTILNKCPKQTDIHVFIIGENLGF